MHYKSKKAQIDHKDLLKYWKTNRQPERLSLSILPSMAFHRGLIHVAYIYIFETFSTSCRQQVHLGRKRGRVGWDTWERDNNNSVSLPIRVPIVIYISSVKVRIWRLTRAIATIQCHFPLPISIYISVKVKIWRLKTIQCRSLPCGLSYRCNWWDYPFIHWGCNEATQLRKAQ